MKKNLPLFLAFLMLGIAVHAQSKYSISFDPFNKIDLTGKMNVLLIEAEKAGAEITLKGLTMDDLSISVAGEKLTIRGNNTLTTENEVTIRLYYTEIREIKLMSGADVSAKRLIKTDSLSLDLGGNSRAYLDLDVLYLSTSLSSGSIFSGEGYADYQEIFAGTSASFSGFQLEGEVVKAKCTTDGQAKVYASKTFYGEVNLGGYISYKGRPEKVDKTVKLGGNIVAAD